MAHSSVLLGAGASVPARLPTAVELTTRALEAAADNPGMALPLNFVVSSLQLHDSRSGGSAIELPDIERLVSAVKMLSERDELEAAPFVFQWDGFIAQLERRARSAATAARELERALVGLIRDARRDASKNSGMLRNGDQSVAKNVAARVQRVAQMATAEGRRDIFGELHDWLLGHVVRELQLRDPQVTAYLAPLARWASQVDGGLVATLNYDLTVETAAELTGVVWHRGVDQWITTGELDPMASDALELVKLHGSLDWTLSGDSLDVHPREDRPFQGSHSPGIIYGRRDKLRPIGPFLQLLERFRSSLMRSQNLVVFGYSFHDAHIDTLIERWLRVSPEARVLVVEHPGFAMPTTAFSQGGSTTATHSQSFRALWNTYGPARFEFVVTSEGAVPERRRSSSPVRFAVTTVGTSSALQAIEADGMDAFVDHQFDLASTQGAKD